MWSPAIVGSNFAVELNAKIVFDRSISTIAYDSLCLVTKYSPHNYSLREFVIVMFSS